MKIVADEQFQKVLFPSVSELNTIQSEAKDIRDNLISILEHALGGDSLCAEYFLCYLLSSV